MHLNAAMAAGIAVTSIAGTVDVLLMHMHTAAADAQRCMLTR